MTHDFDGLSAPARRALAGGGYKTLADLAKVTEADLARLHGMGPNGLKTLRDRLAQAGLSFGRPVSPHPPASVHRPGTNS